MAPSSEQKIVLFMTVNAPGHINSCLAIADRLKQDYAYECVFVFVGRAAGESISKRGHRLIELDDLSCEPGLESRKQSVIVQEFWTRCVKVSWAHADTRKSFKAMTDWMVPRLVGEFLANCAQYEQLIRQLEPSLVVVDHIIVPPYLVREEFNIPWVRIHTLNTLHRFVSKLPGGVMPTPFLGVRLGSKEERERMRRDEPERWQALFDEWARECEQAHQLMEAAFKPVHKFYLEQGIGHRPLEDATEDIDSPYLSLYLLPEVLDYRHEDDILEAPKRFMQCDSLIRETATSQQEQDYWLKLIEEKSRGKQAKVLFSLGTIACGCRKIIEHFLQMLANDQQRLYIVSKGINNESIKLNESNMIGDTYIPQPFLLKHVDLAIIHGGTNGITECLQNGVPTIVFPMFADQFDNAQRVADRQLGRRLPLQVTAEQLIAAVDQVLADEALKQRVKQVGAKMRARDDLSLVTQIFHRLARDKCVDDAILDENGVRR